MILWYFGQLQTEYSLSWRTHLRDLWNIYSRLFYYCIPWISCIIYSVDHMLFTEWLICITYPTLIYPIRSRHLGYNQGCVLCFVISNAHYPTSTTFLYRAYRNLLNLKQYPNTQHIRCPIEANLIEAFYKLEALTLHSKTQRCPISFLQTCFLQKLLPVRSHKERLSILPMPPLPSLLTQPWWREMSSKPTSPIWNQHNCYQKGITLSPSTHDFWSTHHQKILFSKTTPLQQQ